MSDPDITGYRYTARERRLFELGCGNGGVAYELTRCGWDLTGVDPSAEGIEQARAARLAVTGRMDDYFTALWDHGHIKFWSIHTLSMLLEEAGFVSVRFMWAGRIRPLAKSMIAIASKP